MPTRRKKPGHKATNAEVIKRTNKVLTMLVSGYARGEIQQYGSLHWGIREKAIDVLIHHANAAIKKSAEIDLTHELGLAVKRFNQIYKRSMSVDELRTALAANKELATLLGLSKIEVVIKGEMIHEHSVTPAEAGTIFDILAEAGVIKARTPPAEDDEVHSP